MTKVEVDIIVISLVASGLILAIILYVGRVLTKIQDKLEDLAEALQKLGKSPKKKGGKDA